MNSFPYIELPLQFCSDHTGEPMERCVVCGKSVMSNHTPYLIDKAYRNGQLLYEAVMCWKCLEWFEDGQSVMSSVRIEHYTETHKYRESLYDALLQHSAGTIEPWISNCGYTGKPLEAEKTFHYKGLAEEQNLLLTPLFPYALSGYSAGEIWELLSPESMDMIYRFANDYLGVPPALVRDQTEKIENLM
jgi:hypothetical protein